MAWRTGSARPADARAAAAGPPGAPNRWLVRPERAGAGAGCPARELCDAVAALGRASGLGCAAGGAGVVGEVVGCFARVEGPVEALRDLVGSAGWEGPSVASIERDMVTFTATRWPRGRGLAQAGDGGAGGGVAGGCQATGAQVGAVAWHLDRLDAGAGAGLDRRFATPLGLSGAGTHIYVLDTGLRAGHREFLGRVGEGIDLVAAGGGAPDDDNGHGTHCAGLAAGAEFGVAKCAVVHGVKVLDAQGLGSFSDVVRGLDWVAGHAEGLPAVVSMSLAGPPSDSVDRALRDMADLGFLVVAAAGNEGEEACQYSPATSEDALIVGASDVTEAAEGGLRDFRSPFSNYGPCVDVYAPGSTIEAASHTSDETTVFRSGTSMACPLVAGMAALYLEAYPDASGAAVKNAVLQASSPPQEPRRFEPDGAALVAGVAALSVCPPDAEPVDCRVSDWGEWTTATDCPAPGEAPDVCGLRLHRRMRSVEAETECGGAMCPLLWEEAPCPQEYPSCTSFYPMQFFGAIDPQERPAPDFDLRGRHLVFTPSGAGYSVCAGPRSGDLSPIEDTTFSTNLELDDDDSAEIAFGPGTAFPLFGRSYRALHVSSNGFISTSRDTSYTASSSSAVASEGLQAALRGFWEETRVAVLFQDLNPGAGGGVYFEVKQDGARPRLVVSYLDVPLWGPGGQPLAGTTCTAQVILHLESGWNTEAGKIEFWYGDVRGDYNPVVGLSPGLADPAALGVDFKETGLAGAGACPIAASPALLGGPGAGLPVAQGSY